MNVSVLTEIRLLDDSNVGDITPRAKYGKYIASGFEKEFRLFTKYGDFKTGVEMISFLRENNLISSFPNVHIALLICQSIFGSSYKGERSFSILTRIKDYKSISVSRLSTPSRLAIEFEMMRSVSVGDIISYLPSRKYARWKCRTCFIKVWNTSADLANRYSTSRQYPRSRAVVDFLK